jgi:hypothetical protein
MIDSSIPQLREHLPDLFEFVRTLADEIEAGELQDAGELAARIHDFYTADRMAVIEVAAPGWREMAGYADGATRKHVTEALIALQLLPEYRGAPGRLQPLMEWSVLYHDLGKQVIGGQRDSMHAFRSATMAARTLPTVGFPASAAYPAVIDPWTRLVLEASIAAADGRGPVPDKRALPEILQGSEQLFGTGSAAALIVQAVLLHQSLNVVPEWPNPGSLAEADVPLCIRPALLPLLEAMMLVDSDAWQLLDPPSKAKFRKSTLEVFATVRSMVGA